MSRALHNRTSRSGGVLGGFLVAALLLLPGCAPAPQSTPTPTAAPETPAPEPYAGPLAFVGDELELFALTPDEVAGLLPDAPSAGPVSDALLQYSDGGGAEFVPAVCGLLMTETSMRSIGARTVLWGEEAEGAHDSGGQYILQFASEEVAAARMDQLASTVEQCATFEADGPGSFEAFAAPEVDGVRAFAGTFSADFAGNPWSAHHAFAAVGNVIVHLTQPSREESAFDAEAAALLLRDRAVEARATLIDELTANPPEASASPEPGAADAPWGEWDMSSTGTGPLLLGSDRDTALAAVPGATVAEFDWTDNPVRLVSPDGTASLVLWFTEDGSTLDAITAGIANLDGDTDPDGAVLPSTGGVRIGAAISDAVAAFPEGTFLTVVSSGEFFYEWSTREGGTIRFRADRDASDPDAVITGVTIEDATLLPPLSIS
ncbi:hypothetical protein [Microbacterium oxydans]|uniref:hypothetical protein n=1 Tax=Microbacterium oxydans TaxID=82380 RepID=UPI00226B34A1|nr:hypothetical protein [Microbacterium oxydans]WAA67188.1 hypothetical protein MME74_05390 [Microbacterium oxydans]